MMRRISGGRLRKRNAVVEGSASGERGESDSDKEEISSMMA